MLGLVSSVLSQEIVREDRLRNDQFYVEWDVKPLLSHSVCVCVCDTKTDVLPLYHATRLVPDVKIAT